MIKPGKFILSLTLRLELYINFVVVPMTQYFATVTRKRSAEEASLMVAGSLLAMAIMLTIGTCCRYVVLSGILKKIYDDKSDKVDAKLKLMKYPRIEAIIVSVRWFFGMLIPYLMLHFTYGLNSRQWMGFFLILILAITTNSAISYFTTENRLSVIFETEAMASVPVPENSYKEIGIPFRLLITVLSVLIMPMITLGYMLFLVNAGIIRYDNFGLRIVIIMILSLLTLGVLIYEATNGIRASMKITINTLKDLALGDFAARQIPMLNRSELGTISLYTNSLLIKLKEVIVNVKGSSDLIFSSSGNISGASQGLSQSATEQASGMEEISSTIEEMLSSVVQNSENAIEANRLVEESYKLAENGTKVVSDTVESINRINASSKKIEEIITVINSIAFQTNLLALNAAVEAARAGEHGRGFAVVAAEVRNLAQRSRTSSDEIGKLIRNSVENVATGTRLANESGKALNEIFEGIKHVRHIVAEINTASMEQKSGLNQITQAINQADIATQNNAASAEELASTAESLSNNSSEMNEMMKYFKV